MHKHDNGNVQNDPYPTHSYNTNGGKKNIWIVCKNVCTLTAIDDHLIQELKTIVSVPEDWHWSHGCNILPSTRCRSFYMEEWLTRMSVHYPLKKYLAKTLGIVFTETKHFVKGTIKEHESGRNTQLRCNFVKTIIEMCYQELSQRLKHIIHPNIM